MTPKRDAQVRRRAAEILAWCESELAITEPWVNPPEAPLDHSLGIEAWRAALDEQTRRHREFRDRPDIRRISEYREWLHGVAAFCRFRRRHPIARLVARSRHIGRVECGEYGHPDTRFSWRWQNLNDDLMRRPMSPAIGPLGLPDLRHQGRAWIDWYLRSSDTKPLKIEVEWTTGKAVWSTGVSLGRSSAGSATFHLAIRPIASVYLTLRHALPRILDERSRTYSLTFFGDTLQWDLGKPGSGDEWHRNDPLNWMRGCRFWPDDIFGRAVHVCEKIGEPVRAVACFPEGQYTLTLQRERRTWKRPRWPWPLTRDAVDITLERPPEFQGKGENSWDCGPDAIYGMSSPGHSYEDAVAAYVKAVLRERARQGHLAPEHRTILTGV